MSGVRGGSHWDTATHALVGSFGAGVGAGVGVASTATGKESGTTS